MKIGLNYKILIILFLTLNNYFVFSNVSTNKIKETKEFILIDSLKDQLNHNDCIRECLKTLSIEPINKYVNKVLCFEYNQIRKWDSCIIVGQKFNEINNFPLYNYDELYLAYCEKRNYNKAIELSKIAIKNNVNVLIAKQNLKELTVKQSFSKWVSILFSLILSCLYFYYYRNKSIENKQFRTNFISLIYLVFSISIIIYFLFYAFAPYFWSLNTILPIDNFTHLVKYEIYDKDGIESFILYCIAFLSIFSSYIISIKISSSINIFVSFVLSILFVNIIGFHPPLLAVNKSVFELIQVVVIISLLSLFLSFLFKFNKRIFYFSVVIILILICFRSIGEISLLDNSIILLPSLQLLQGESLSEIYFQYDLFLSLIALFFLKFHINFDLIQFPFQLSYFLFFIGVLFLFNKFLFIKKNSVYLFLIILIVKFYSYSHEPTYAFGQTPLRIDLWLIPLLLSFFFGVRHWSVAFALALFLIFHKNLGIIYLVAYLQLLFILFLLDFKKFTLNSVLNNLKFHLKKNRFVLIIILFGFIVSIFLFKGFIPKSAVLFSSLGINFLKIPIDSFYWFIFPLNAIVFVLLIRNINFISNTYLNTGIFIILLSIGNSMYFFGRSHDSQFIQILALPIITFFILIDLLFKLKIIQSSKMISLITFSCLILTSFIYSDNIYEKGKKQIDNYKKKRFIYSITSQPKKEDFQMIKSITNNSSKVAFVFCGTKRSTDDFLYYWKGGYVLKGKPLMLEVFTKDQISRIDSLTSKGYYVVTSTPEYLHINVINLVDLKNKTLGRYTAFYK